MSEAIWMQAYTDRLNGWRDAHIEARIAVDQKLIVKLIILLLFLEVFITSIFKYFL